LELPSRLLPSAKGNGIVRVGRVNAQDTRVESNPDLPLEIAHLLLIDLVGYSKLLINEQIELLQELNQIVRETECFRSAEARGKLNRVPMGDGMALLFFRSPEEPVRCALEISRTLYDHPHIQVRMGVHSGPVNRVTDVDDKTNFAGSGINIAQRVVDCGDAGHILLSGHLAEDLTQYRHWQPYLHDLGECEVKHGLRLHLFNLYKDNLGNPHLPDKLKRRRRWKQTSRASVRPVITPRWPNYLLTAVLLVSAVALAISFSVFYRRGSPAIARSSSEKAVDGGLPIAEKSIAVLPFENRSEEKANAYFADGVQDEILTYLAKIAALKVISRTSVMQYKSGVARNLREIAQQLGVANVVEGSVQRSGNRVRVNAQLVDARTDAHLWAQTYDRDLADVFAIQSEIAKAIVDQLQAKLSPNEKKAIEQPPTTDLAAFDLYSQAKSLLLTANFSATVDPDLQKAIKLLDEAVKRDPSFFDAYCQLARAHEFVYAVTESDHTPARLALAEAALQAAARLRPDAAETHLARAQYLYYGLRDYAGALAELEIARRALPNDPRLFELTGYILRRRGQQEEGLRNLERAVELDPRNVYTLQQIAGSYQFLGRYAETIAALDRALAIMPDHVETRTTREEYYFYWKADTRPLRQMIDVILAQEPNAIVSAADDWFSCALAERDSAAAEGALVALGDNPCWGEDAITLSHSFGEGLLARMTKDEARARTAFEAARAQQEKIVQAQPDYGPALCVLGLIDAALGRKDLALDEGRRAIALTPLEKDVNNGSRVLQYFAITAAWAGDKELALQQLEAGLRAPVASLMLSYGALKLLPFWDLLRGDPRFEKIVASLAPKAANK
jgi:TolB-like protein/class 3 adenylate cyclase/Tfp pilus assembly protein PilF